MGGVDVNAVNAAIDARAKHMKETTLTENPDYHAKAFTDVARSVVGSIYLDSVLNGGEATTQSLIDDVNRMSRNPNEIQDDYKPINNNYIDSAMNAIDAIHINEHMSVLGDEMVGGDVDAEIKQSTHDVIVGNAVDYINKSGVSVDNFFTFYELSERNELPEGTKDAILGNNVGAPSPTPVEPLVEPVVTNNPSMNP